MSLQSTPPGLVTGLVHRVRFSQVRFPKPQFGASEPRSGNGPTLTPLHANPQTPAPTSGLEKEGALGGVGPVEIDSGAFETGPIPPNPEP